MKLLRLSIKELVKRKFFSILMFLVCVIAMQTILSAITNATSAAYQQKMFENNIGVDMEKVLHLDYQYTEENPEFANVIRQYLNYIKELPGVETIGQFDATGMYFSELENMKEYKSINGELLKGQKYENYPGISQLLSIDEEILSFVKGGITEYAATTSGLFPIYVSEIFKDILSEGQILTDARTGDQYEIVGYFSTGTKWVEEDDIIRFPLISLDGWFIAPFTEKSRDDIMTQLSSLHNTYVFLSDNADTDFVKEQIASYPLQHDFEASAMLLSAEYEVYRSETATFTTRQMILALFISIMAIGSIVAVFTTNILLKKKQYGVWFANGFTLSNIANEIVIEIFSIIFCSGILAWVMKWIEFEQSTDLFKMVLLTAHIRYTLPLYVVLMFILTGVAALIPVTKLLKYRPCELIGGDINGND